MSFTCRLTSKWISFQLLLYAWCMHRQSPQCTTPRHTMTPRHTNTLPVRCTLPPALFHPQPCSDHTLTNLHVYDAFDWSTKQIFVYVVAEFSTPKMVRNEIILWDHLVLSRDDAVLSFKGLEPEYPLLDFETGLNLADVTFTVRYERVPISGLLRLFGPISTEIVPSL
eukprot:TRINITY_DN534_c0_g3_i2.p1 TRINITY_DN534_c0_g3~~TRINITY_DN534_c0_g3_i2.p1  ORF type:complete len:168 (+),score=6.64 TRINITY_DN534_c0_g3_i2:520-1023(+)